MRTAKTLVIAAVTGIALPAPLLAEGDDLRGIQCWPPLPPRAQIADILFDEQIELTSGGADITNEGDATFSGPIEMLAGDRQLRADSADYTAATGKFTVTGDVGYSDPLTSVKGSSAYYETTTGLFEFKDTEFELQTVPARGSAESVRVRKTGDLKLTDVRYTSCPAGNDDWMLRAKSIEVDMESGMGTARGASLRFKGVPFLYVPYFTYPVTDDRKSGLLFPKVGSSDRRGFEVTQPIYWNIAPAYDATIVPHYMSDRGTQLGTEFRFLTRRTYGELWGDFLPDDDITNTDRWRYDIDTKTALPADWRASVLATGVSDDFYFEDMSSNRSETSQTNLNRSVDLERYTNHWSLFFRVQDFQTIDPNITPDNEPYAQLPQFIADGEWTDSWLGLDYRLGTETSYFYRDNSVNGARLHVQPEVALPLRGNGLYLVPEVAFDYTTYKLTDLEDDTADDTPDRTAPIVSVNAGAIFDRISGKSDQWLVTLEPRVQYVYIPFRDQSDIPVFDTIQPDFNLVQLFRKNRYVGYDRLGDTSQLSWGVTGRMLQSDDGQEILTATLGQALFFDSGDVSLPDEQRSSSNSSDYFAEIGVNVWENWGFDWSIQYDSEDNRTERSSVRVKYRPGEFKAVNLAYRYVDGSLEQTDLSLAWPIGDKWSFIGRYNYSLLEDKALDQFVGVEYESCCWVLKLLSRRTVSRSTGERDASLSLQFLLKGFSSLGSEASTGLQRAILEGRDY